MVGVDDVKKIQKTTYLIKQSLFERYLVVNGKQTLVFCRLQKTSATRRTRWTSRTGAAISRARLFPCSPPCCYGCSVGSKVGSGGVASQSETNRDRKERLRQLALETIDLAKDPYFMRNHLGSYVMPLRHALTRVYKAC